MSTNDVPGAKPENHDVLAMGAWAEHDDGSLIFVEAVEAGTVVYSIFDVQDPPVEYRDAMPETGFKERFSWRPGDDAVPQGRDQRPPRLRPAHGEPGAVTHSRVANREHQDGGGGPRCACSR